MDKHERRRLIAEAQELPADLHVGKAGVTEGVLDEVDRQLEERGLVKVKLLPSARDSADRTAVAAGIAEGTGSELLEVRGHTAVFWRKKGSKFRRKEKS